MEVILLKNLDNLGSVGQVVNVKRGYARNYLLPQGFAVEATPAQMNRVAKGIEHEKAADAKRKLDAEGLAAQYADLSCTITAQAGEEDRLFGSVGPRDIVAALAEQGIEFDRKQIDLEEPIKQLGVYSVPVKLHPEVTVEIKVWVVKS
jgi:large subunit ribosomal protein L9